MSHLHSKRCCAFHSEAAKLSSRYTVDCSQKVIRPGCHNDEAFGLLKIKMIPIFYAETCCTVSLCVCVF